MRNISHPQPHFDAAQRSGQHQIVEITKMADPEHLAGQPRQPVAKRHVEIRQHCRPEGISIMTVRQQYRRQRAGIVARFLAQHLQPPCLDGAAGGFGMPVMARKDVVEAFLVKHVDGLGKTIEKVRRRRIGKGTALVGGKLVLPVPVGAWLAVALRLGDGALGQRVEGQARRQHQPLLRA